MDSRYYSNYDVVTEMKFQESRFNCSNLTQHGAPVKEFRCLLCLEVIKKRNGLCDKCSEEFPIKD